MMSLSNIMDALVEQFEGDEVFVRDMLGLFLDQVQTFKVRLQKAFEQKDDAQLLALAHELKGMALNLGFTQMSTVAAGLESRVKASSDVLAGLVALNAQIDQDAEMLSQFLAQDESV